MTAFVLSIALALVSHSGSQTARRAETAAHFPSKGVVVPGVSFAGIKLGDSEQHVRSLWGNTFTTCGFCADTTWLYTYRGGEPLGAGVRFRKNRVVAVFSLGSPAGWKTDKGLNMGDPVSNVYSYYGSTGHDPLCRIRRAHRPRRECGDRLLQRCRRRLRLRPGRPARPRLPVAAGSPAQRLTA